MFLMYVLSSTSMAYRYTESINHVIVTWITEGRALSYIAAPVILAI